MDYTSQIWLTGFNDFGLILFGREAGELEKIQVCSSSLFPASRSMIRKTELHLFSFPTNSTKIPTPSKPSSRKTLEGGSIFDALLREIPSRSVDILSFSTRVLSLEFNSFVFSDEREEQSDADYFSLCVWFGLSGSFFQDSEVIKYSIQNVSEPIYKLESQHLIAKIREYGVINF